MKRKTLSPGTPLNSYLISSDAGQDAFGASYIVRYHSDDQHQKRFLIREFFPAALSERRAGQVVPAGPDLTEAFSLARTRCSDLFERLETIRHDCLMPLADRFESNNTLYMVSAWPEGETLAEIVQNYGELSPENLYSLFEVILPALAALEAGGVVHAGISPDTIFRRDDGRPVLNTPAFPCHAGDRLIVPFGKSVPNPYIAPEVFADPAETILTSAADVYAFAASCVYLLTGVAPPLALDRRAGLAQGGGDLIDWNRVEAACDGNTALFAALQTSMSLSPEMRPQGFAAFSALVMSGERTGKPLFGAQARGPVPSRSGSDGLKLVMGLAAGLVVALGVFFAVPGFLPPESWRPAAPGSDAIPSSLPEPEPLPVTTLEAELLPGQAEDLALRDDFLAAEQGAWDQAVAVGDAAAFQAYLDEYGPESPNPGFHAEEAGMRLAALLEAEIQPPPDPEEDLPDDTEQVPEPEPIPVGVPFRDCADCPQLVRLPSGSFRMGAPTGEPGSMPSERPLRSVRIDRHIAMTTHEITVKDYTRFLLATGGRARDMCSVHAQDRPAYWTLQSGKSLKDPGFAQSPAHPAVCIAWDDAKAYADWLSSETGQVYRLPSEAEWEYAARAGAETAWFWGQDDGAACRFANAADTQLTGLTGQSWLASDCSDGQAFTAPVGRYQKNRFGLFDMAGNVLEWTEDCRTAGYEIAPVDGSASSDGDCRFRSVRGGSWASSADQLRSAKRHFVPASVRYNTIGFRLVRVVQETPTVKNPDD